MLIIEMEYSKRVYELQLKNLVERTKECHFYHEMYKIKMQLTKLVAQETVRKKKKAGGLHENWRGREPDPQRQQAVWINVTSAAPWRVTETQRAHPQDRSSRRREKVTAV